jgi:hypothetical protein
MDKITRYIKRSRNETELVYPFTTWSCIFGTKSTAKDGDILYSVYKHLRTAFYEGMPECEASPSQAKQLMVQTERIESDLCEMAEASGYHGMGKAQHPIVQNYFMDNHPDCVAVEMPVWDDKMAGFVDITLVNANGIKLLDFKPLAHKEKHAATQLYHYKRLFCHNTGLSPDLVECYYFDNQNCYKVIC